GERRGMLAYQFCHCEQNAPALLCRGLAPGTAIERLAGGSYCIINVFFAGLGDNASSFSVEGIHNIPGLFRRCPLVIDEVLVSSKFRFCLHISLNLSDRRTPLLASPQGGVAEPSRKCREHPQIARPGWFSDRTKGKPPRLHLLRWLREIFLMTQ